MSAFMLTFSEELATYLRCTGQRDTQALQSLREENAELPLGLMQISQEQGAFMANLVRMIGAKKTIEVGTFTGYSALVVALALPEDGIVVACDVSEEWTSIGRKYWEQTGVAHKIDLQLRPAIETLDQLLADGGAGTFDFAFIDADKSNYDTYYERCLTLLRKNGVIAVDNVLWGGAVVDDSKQDDDTKAIRALNQKIHADDRVDINMLPVGDGLTLAVKR
jgi:predicted O-methyltransferase YrrM